MTDSNNCIQSVQVRGLPLKVSSFSVGRVTDEIGVVINCCLWVWSWQFTRPNEAWCCGNVVWSNKFIVADAWKEKFDVSVFWNVAGWFELSVIPVEADKVSCGISLCSDSFCSVCYWRFVGNLVCVSVELLTRSELTFNFLRTKLSFLRESRLTANVSSKNLQCCDSSRLSRRNSLVFSSSDSNCWTSFSPSMNSSYGRFSSVEMSSIRCSKRNICEN